MFKLLKVVMCSVTLPVFTPASISGCSVAEEIARQIETVKREFNTADSDGERANVIL